MYSVHDLPEGLTLPPIQQLIVGRPTSVWGMPVEWSSTAALRTRRRAGGRRVPWRRSLRRVLRRSRVAGWPLDAARLVQRESPTYSAAAEADDYVDAATIRDPSSLSIRHAPRWKPTDAVWPTRLG